jgi:hypothetical protein
MRGKEPGSNLALCAFSLIREPRFRCVIIPEHKVATAAEIGWSTLSNGELLDAAEREFNLLVTTDQALRTQQNLSKRRIAILVLPFASWPRLEPNAETIASRVATVRSGEYVEICSDSWSLRERFALVEIRGSCY